MRRPFFSIDLVVLISHKRLHQRSIVFIDSGAIAGPS